MLHIISKLLGYSIQASDGKIGTVSDFLFDDETWKLRWLVANTGSWLTERKVLIHPSAIIHPSTLGQPDFEQETLPVALTKAQIEASPSIEFDQPVSRQIESNLYEYYGWDPLWSGASYFTGGSMASPLLSPAYFGRAKALDAASVKPDSEEADPHLRSVAEVTGYHIKACDGEIGHIETFLIDDASWSIRYLVIDTGNWWFGNHVLSAPYAIREITWADRTIGLDISRAKVKAGPVWNPLDDLDQAYERRLHTHYGWPGYGW